MEEQEACACAEQQGQADPGVEEHEEEHEAVADEEVDHVGDGLHASQHRHPAAAAASSGHRIGGPGLARSVLHVVDSAFSVLAALWTPRSVYLLLYGSALSVLTVLWTPRSVYLLLYGLCAQCTYCFMAPGPVLCFMDGLRAQCSVFMDSAISVLNAL